MTSVALIKTCLNLAYYSGITHILRKPLRGRGTIFCFHHVVPTHHKRGEFSPNAKLEITPEFLRSTIAFAHKRGYEPMSLTDAMGRLQNPKTDQKPFAVFTLDDGYRDNLVHALPVFRELNCPFTVFVSPGIVEGTVELWWRALEKIIAENLSIFVEISGFTHSYKTQSIAEKYRAWDILSLAFQDAPEYQQREIIRNICDRYAIDLNAMCLDAAMNWDEIREMANDPLCSIGAHTMGHFAVGKLSVADAKFEIEQSRKIISEKLGRPVEHFAYPYGDRGSAGVRDFNLAEKIGYTSAVTTRKGVVTKFHQANRQALPRVMVSGRYSKLRYLDTMMSGLPGAFINLVNGQK
jgi:peptidoglycan/xylan/chitin deacetylase (PgdA/CDA1 family)